MASPSGFAALTLTLVILNMHHITSSPIGAATTTVVTFDDVDISNSSNSNNTIKTGNNNNNSSSVDDADNSGSGDIDTVSSVIATQSANTSRSTNASDEITPLTKCEFDYSEDERNSIFSQHHNVLHFHVMGFKVKAGKSRCYMTRNDLERKLLVAPERDVIGAFGVVCREAGTEVVFLENEEARELEWSAGGSTSRGVEDEEMGRFLNYSQSQGTQYRWHPRYIQYFQTGNCRISMKAVWMVANMTELRVFTAVGNQAVSLSELQDEPGLCEAFRHMVSFSVVSDPTLQDNLHYLTHCRGYLDTVVEMDFYNNSLTSFPGVLRDTIPNLRALALKGNNLTSPIEFPWKPGFAVLPRNLSRTYQFNIHYNFDGAFDMPPDLFRKVYSLDENKITNLTKFQFSGEFQYITVERNGLNNISQHVFDRVPDVEFLSLAYNSLDSVPEDLFASLRNLKRLDLQGNNLTRLPDNVFKKLVRLETLNIENNRLEVIQDGLFTTLEQLKTVKLKNNNLVVISDLAFSTMSVKITSLDLQGNPLKEVPPVVFLLRGLKLINLEYTAIEVLDFAEIDRRTRIYVMVEALKNPTTGAVLDINVTPEYQRILSLKYSQLRSIVMHNATEETRTTFMLIIKHFTINTEHTKLTCDCNILNVTHLLNEWKAEGRLQGTEACLRGWKCIWPDELWGKPVADLLDDETYCPLQETRNVTSCPKGCSCYKRTGVNTVIVDCKNVGLTLLPAAVPAGTTELWLQNNTLENLECLPYLKHIVSLNMTSNHIKSLPVAVLGNMTILQSLDIKDNWLTGLDEAFANLGQLVHVRLSGNPFRCDCNSRWLKGWLLRHQRLVRDWDEIKCSTDEAEGQTFTAVDDAEFTCKVSATLDQLAVPVAVPVAMFLPLLTLGVVAVLLRRRLKVMLYIYTGFHPFDRDPPDHHALYDVTVCCDVTARAWILRNVVEPLEHDYRYKVFFYSRDAFLGFTISENVRHCVRHSRRVAVVLESGSDKEDVLVTAVREALAKCRKDMVQFMTVLLHKISPKDIQDPDLRQYTRRGRYISTDDKHFIKRLVYEMPHLKSVSRPGKTDKPTTNKDSSKSTGKAGTEPIAHTERVVFHDIVAVAEKEQNWLAEKVENVVNNREFCRQISGDSGIMDLKDAVDSRCVELEYADVETEERTEERHERKDGGLEQRQGGQDTGESRAEKDDPEHDTNLPQHGDVLAHRLKDRKNDALAANPFAHSANGAVNGTGRTHKRVEESVRKSDLLALKQDARKSTALALNPIYIRQPSYDNPAAAETTRAPKSIFVWYADVDLAFTLKNIVDPIEKMHHACVLQDRDFPLGAAIQENIVHAAHTCTRTIFVLSSRTAQDEWFTFTFHVAFDRHLQSREHRVALLKREDCDVTRFVPEVQQTIMTSALLSDDDPWFWKRLLKFVDFDQVDIC